ncbi:magnesium chelatase ATPase subunit I [Aureimonas leprariae]|uniref:Mg-protoporphyrin IX chelatase n=1 Tax=Plantimonas leprariae TaxID=2615207 RepID=A0A7V7PQH4_9HYPH|nr:magnesium chelatase ATPase subunit I [Aureimonas leprariae]KAB0680433.1 magnesium chelatase ATPase subunit I [Aureimonas leprariae]
MEFSYPFSAIVGQEEMKRALLLAAVDPRIGGILVFGHRGTGKTTAIRGLAGLLPPMRVTGDCRYNCDPADERDRCPQCAKDAANGRAKSRKAPVPVVDLPLGATEDRVAGALDLEKALVSGEKAFEPGLLARAHRGFLYIDEVNLLEDHLVDLLLDVSASGFNVVEREGLSVRHAARFVLVGSGNPEEGELRPQLLDRFGLSVEVASPGDVATRVEVVKRRDAFDRDPRAFAESWKRKDAALRARIGKARDALSSVATSDAVLEQAAALCLALGVDGLRGELTLVRAARALTALEGGAAVTAGAVRAVAVSALRHRLRRDPLDESGSGARVERALVEIAA